MKCKPPIKPVVQTRASQAKMTPDKALELLKAGNERFVSGCRLNRGLREQVRETAGGQYPYSAVDLIAVCS